jgi:predicted RNA-binding protein Jag
MKSIVEEASSVAKAIDKAWVLAGKPQEFSIKVFEIEQKNFLGITSKPAKIAIFYNEKATEKASSRHELHDKRGQQPSKRGQQEHKHAAVKKERRPAAQAEQLPSQKQPRIEEPREARDAWTDEMVAFCEQWLKTTLSLMNLGHKGFSLEAKNYYLKINFSQDLLADDEREKLLFRSFAYLIMQSLRTKFKKGFRGFKIILNSGR